MAASKTKYRVLIETGTNDYALLKEGVEAHSSAAAMKYAAEAELSNDVLAKGVVLVAVPESNWTEEPVGIVTPEPVLRVGVPGQITVEEALAETEPEATDGD